MSKTIIVTTNGQEIRDMTTSEQAEHDALIAEINSKKADRKLERIKKMRLEKLKETDYMALSDVTMTDAWKTYRQALRDITSQTPTDIRLSNITFPTKPS